MDNELRARLEEQTADSCQKLAAMEDVQERASRVTATARSFDGLVTVEVGAQGQLVTMRLEPRVYDRLPPHELEATVMALATAAAADAAAQVRDIMAAVLPPGRLAATLGMRAGGWMTGRPW